MLTVQVDEQVIDEIVEQEIARKVEVSAHRYTFWDMKELCRQTNMSENFIKEHFFYDEQFPRFRVGRKWLMPAKEAIEVLTRILKRGSLISLDGLFLNFYVTWSI